MEGRPKYSSRPHPQASADIRGMCGRRMEDGICEIMRKNREKRHKWHKLGRGGRNIASVSIRGHPRHVWTEDGRWKMVIMRGTRENPAQMAEARAGWPKYFFRLLPSASVSFRGRPWK